MRTRLRAALALALVALPAVGIAGEAQDRIFRLGLLRNVPAGETLVYSRTRDGTLTTPAVPAIADGAVEIGVVAEAGGRTARIELTRDGETVSRSTLPADGGHPALLVFLESTARAMADLTGGSPFNIRNRMREALGADAPLEPVEVVVAGAAAPGEEATFRPFVDDPNRDRMGALADLELRIVLSDAAPGGFARLEAVAGAAAGRPPAYADAIAFAAMKGR